MHLEQVTAVHWPHIDNQQLGSKDYDELPVISTVRHVRTCFSIAGHVFFSQSGATMSRVHKQRLGDKEAHALQQPLVLSQVQ